MVPARIALFALDATREFGADVARCLGVGTEPHEERGFDDGEHKTRPMVSVRGRDVFVIQSLYGEPGESVNDKLCRLLFFLGALRDASAARVTAVVPYLCYSRKDRKSKPRDPVTTRYVAALFESVGVDATVTMDVHNPAAFQNAWRVPADHLEARKLLVDAIVPLAGDRDVAVVSPDVGGVKRAEDFRQSLSMALHREVRSAFLEKYRSAGQVSGHAVVGEVSGRVAVVVDDLVGSGTTLARAAEACRMHGAERVYAAVTHGVFSGDAAAAVSHPALEKLIVTTTIPPFRLPPDLVREKLIVVDVAPMFAVAIGKMHSGGSIVELNE